jgi:SAM-dependent methyltransferase
MAEVREHHDIRQTDAPGSSRETGWKRLWRHSYRLGLHWLLQEAPGGWKGARVGIARLLVPMDPWRYYELGRIAEQPFHGRCLDVSSPKLLTSLLHRERQGRWVGLDLYEKEIFHWRHVDPSLPLIVTNAARLPFPDSTFDHALCISVIEHVPSDLDSRVMAEIWRTLKPGAILHLTTPVAKAERDVYIEKKVYGKASHEVDGRVFFERHYSDKSLQERLLRDDWDILEREIVRDIRPGVQRIFYRWAPLSYFAGGLLRLVCPWNYKPISSLQSLQDDEAGVVYLRLKKRVHSAAG